jgi:branched-chain amino acid transport system permease protein
MRRYIRSIWLAMALAALLAYPWLLRAPYFHVLGFNVLMFATMGVSWNILGGYAGYKSLGHGAFFGLGAYVVAIAAARWGWNPLWSAPILAFATTAVAIVLGWVMLRTSGSAFVIATIALLLIFRILALNMKDLTGGSPGLSQPLPPWTPEFSRMPFYYYMLGCLIAALLVSAFVRRTRLGLGLLAIRDDEGKAAMVGVNTTLYKVIAFGLSAYFVALAGGIWSYFSTHISPVFAFDTQVSVDMILVTMLGGLGTLWGPVLGAFILLPAADLILFRFGSSEIHLAILGVLMLAIILFLPRGVLPTVQEWLEQRAAPRSAFSGARSMAEHVDQGDAAREQPAASERGAP